MQEGEAMQQEVCWPADRLHAECSTLRQELERLHASVHSSSNARTVADVDNELEALESEKRNADMRKDNLLQKQNRLRCSGAKQTWILLLESLFIT